MRILVGEVPATFFVEVIIRIAVVYLILMVSMRLMGKRMASMLSRTELVAIVSLAAAIGMPLQAPDRGLLPAIIIAIVVVCMHKVLSALAYKNERFESYFQGRIAVLVQNSVLELETMKKSQISRERLYAQLRYEGIRHLGEVKRLYLEANGAFCLIKETNIQPGLPFIPEQDTDMLQHLAPSGNIICKKCGAVKNDKEVFVHIVALKNLPSHIYSPAI